MTGWRMGWAIAPAAVVKAMDTIQSQETSCPSSVSQAALIAALDGPQECVAEMRAEFAARRELVFSLLTAIPGVKVPHAEGAYASSPVWLENVPRPVRWGASVLELGLHPIAEHHRWSIDQWTPPREAG